MILCIASVLTVEEIDQVRAGLEGATFIDGRATAGWHARLVKHNVQADGRAPEVRELQALVGRALRRNALFELAVRPQRVQPVLFSRYETGMDYGAHVDDALMGATDPMRSDVSATLFLSEPTDYGGGELVIDTTVGEQDFKLNAGAMVVYPSSTLHRVEPVTSGTRLAAVTWIQSLVREAARRELLFDLETARRTLFEQHGKTREFDLISKSIANLLRLWAEL